MSLGIGFIFAVITVIGWGSNFVPVKKFPSGDGLYFQWVLSTGVWMTGFIVYCARGFPQFEPYMLIGGVLWCTGNVMTVAIVRLIGLGLGLLLWNLSCLATGWAITRFGFGNIIKSQGVSVPALNYAGIFLVAIAGCCFLFVSPVTEKNDSEKSSDRTPEEQKELVTRDIEHHNAQDQKKDDKEDKSKDLEKGNQSPLFDVSAEEYRRKRLYAWTIPEHKHFWNIHEIEHLRHQMIHFFHLDSLELSEKLHHLPFNTENWGPLKKRIVGASMALLAGVLYGVNVLPLQYLLDHSQGGKAHSTNSLDYVFPHFCGIYFAASVYFMLYCIVMRNKPQIYPHVTAPAVASGIIWAIAQISFFIASEHLGMVMAFPLSSSGPGIVAALWSVLLFKEIVGRKNLIVLGISFCFSLIAVTLITLSKVL